MLKTFVSQFFVNITVGVFEMAAWHQYCLVLITSALLCFCKSRVLNLHVLPKRQNCSLSKTKDLEGNFMSTTHTYSQYLTQIITTIIITSQLGVQNQQNLNLHTFIWRPTQRALPCKTDFVYFEGWAHPPITLILRGAGAAILIVRCVFTSPPTECLLV